MSAAPRSLTLQATCPHSSTFTGHFPISFHLTSPRSRDPAISRSDVCGGNKHGVSSRETTAAARVDDLTSPFVSSSKLVHPPPLGEGKPLLYRCSHVPRDYTSEKHVRQKHSGAKRPTSVSSARSFAGGISIAKDSWLSSATSCVSLFELEIETDVTHKLRRVVVETYPTLIHAGSRYRGEAR